MKTLKTLLITALLFGAPSAMASAQVSPNQHEMMRQYGLDCSQRYDGCANNNTPPPPQEVWENKYAAIALDTTAGEGQGIGIADDVASARQARRLALARCGSRNCRIVAEVTNTCLAAGYGGGMVRFGSDNDEAKASQEILDKCAADGVTCEIHYSHCNRPVRIR